MKVLLYINLFIVCFFIQNDKVYAQEIQRNVAVVAYIYNFAKNVQWQNEESLKEFHFLIVGQDPGIMQEMSKLSKTKTIRNKPIKVTAAENLNDIENIQLIFVTKESQSKLVKIFDLIERKNILLISDSYTDKKLIMINLFDSKQGALLFEINNANIINQNIKIMPDMILLGGTQIDVAELYRDGQQSLRNIQKHSEILEQNLIILNNTLAEKTKEIAINKDSLKSQAQKMKEQQNTLFEQTTLLTLQSTSLKLQQNKLSQQSKEIDNQQQILKSQSQKLSVQSQKLAYGEEVLKKQNIDIVKQQSKIERQRNNINKQDLTINKQRNTLFLLIIIIILVVILALTIFYAYKNKKKSNKELEKKVADRTHQLNQLNEELENKVKKRTTQLENANKELEAFAYSVSHDLRAPLRAISGYTRILMEDYSNKLDSDGQRFCGVIQSEATRMGHLIDDLLSFSRLSRTHINISLIDMNVLIEQIFNEVKEPYSHIPISFSIGQLLNVYGDESLIKQIWINLISNALKFSSKKETIKIEIDSYEEETEIVYFIKDNGAGFDIKYIDKLFGVFQRLHNQNDFDGTGVGLAIVKRIVHRHGGRVWAHSEINNGAIFYITFPKSNNHE